MCSGPKTMARTPTCELFAGRKKKAPSRAFSDTEFESTLTVMASYEIKDPGFSPGS